MTQIAKNIALWISKQRFTPFRYRRSLIKRIFPDILKDHEFETNFFGYKYKGNMRDYINRNIYLCGAHEKYMLYFLRDYVYKHKLEDSLYIDVGANVGNHALFMSKIVKQVHAFEPYEKVREQLDRTINDNEIENIEVYPVGLGECEEKLPFYQPPDSNLGAASFNKGNGGSELYIGDLELKTGDSIFAGLNDKISIIKMDIEGHEPFALKGLQKVLAEQKPLVVLELLPATKRKFASEKEFYSLFPAGYKFLRFKKTSNDTGKYQLAPFEFDKNYKHHDVIAVPPAS
jgi:FkbM family methyltransferase